MLRAIVAYDDLTDAEVSEWFKSTPGSKAPKSFAADMLEIGEQQRSDAEDPATGDKLYRIFDDVAKAVVKEFVPSRFKSLELARHFIAEDGDVELRLLIARQKDNSWTVVTYSDFPF